MHKQVYITTGSSNTNKEGELLSHLIEVQECTWDPSLPVVSVLEPDQHTQPERGAVGSYLPNICSDARPRSREHRTGCCPPRRASNCAPSATIGTRLTYPWACPPFHRQLFLRAVAPKNPTDSPAQRELTGDVPTIIGALSGGSTRMRRYETGNHPAHSSPRDSARSAVSTVPLWRPELGGLGPRPPPSSPPYVGGQSPRADATTEPP